MAYDQTLADRISARLLARQVLAEEKKMMGGLAFMIRGSMCCGIVGHDLMLRIGPEQYQQVLHSSPHCREMTFTGRPLKGFVYIAPDGLANDTELDAWLAMGLAYNASLPEKAPKPAKTRSPKPRNTP